MEVLSSEEGVGQYKIGMLELNAPQRLNALNGEMLFKISKKLQGWEERSDIAAIVLHGNSPKAFCAGGDIKNLVLNYQKEGSEKVARKFFALEYFTDHLIHTLKTPVIAWSEGIVMGGGMGLMNGCASRLVTESTLMAMPEISIGFFPDVGAGYFLNQIPYNLGMFLGLTGARFKAGDAIEWGLADHYIETSKRQVFADLMRQNWSENTEANSVLVKSYFESLQVNSKAPRAWEGVEPQLIELCASKSLEEFDQKILAIATQHNSFQQALQFYKQGSPFSKRLFYEGLLKMKDMSLKEVFKTEWSMAVHSSMGLDFPEGVRALLIDKDQKPNWEHSEIPSVEAVAGYFEGPEPCDLNL